MGTLCIVQPKERTEVIRDLTGIDCLLFQDLQVFWGFAAFYPERKKEFLSPSLVLADWIYFVH